MQNLTNSRIVILVICFVLHSFIFSYTSGFTSHHVSYNNRIIAMQKNFALLSSKENEVESKPRVEMKESPLVDRVSYLCTYTRTRTCTLHILIVYTHTYACIPINRH